MNLSRKLRLTIRRQQITEIHPGRTTPNRRNKIWNESSLFTPQIQSTRFKSMMLLMVRAIDKSTELNANNLAKGKMRAHENGFFLRKDISTAPIPAKVEIHRSNRQACRNASSVSCPRSRVSKKTLRSIIITAHLALSGYILAPNSELPSPNCY